MGTRNDSSGTHLIFWLAAVAGVWLLLNFIGLPLGWGGISADAGVLGAIQLGMLLGFGLVLLFDIVSIGWLMRMAGISGEPAMAGGLIAFGILALLAMMGAKVMVDEIARETPLGGAGGEWGMLYALLTVQLAYIIVVFARAMPRRA